MTEIYIGQKAENIRLFTQEDIEVFSAVSNDFHSSQADTRSGRKMVHSAAVVAGINALIMNQLPGPSTTILEQSVNYLQPVYVAERLTFTAEVIAVQHKKKLVIVQTQCINQDNVKVVGGEAVVYIPDLEMLEP